MHRAAETSSTLVRLTARARALAGRTGSTVLELAGAALITIGVGQIYLPAGIITGGVLIGVLGFLLEPADDPGRGNA